MNSPPWFQPSPGEKLAILATSPPSTPSLRPACYFDMESDSYPGFLNAGAGVTFPCQIVELWEAIDYSVIYKTPSEYWTGQTAQTPLVIDRYDDGSKQNYGPILDVDGASYWFEIAMELFLSDPVTDTNIARVVMEGDVSGNVFGTMWVNSGESIVHATIGEVILVMDGVGGGLAPDGQSGGDGISALTITGCGGWASLVKLTDAVT